MNDRTKQRRTALNQNEKGHYAWDCIGELAGRRLLNMDEKAAVCRKIRESIYKPSFAVTIAVKIMPFLAVLTLLVGIKYILQASSALTTTCGVIIFTVSLVYIVSALFFYLVKEIWVYDKWKAQEKEIMKKDMYRVPVTIGEPFRAGGKKKHCYATLKYTQDEDFLDTYQITEYLYNHANEAKAYCCYYEGKPEKYNAGKYKLFFISADNELEE